MAIQDMSDGSLLRFYENIRDQIAEDVRLGGRHRFIGVGVKEYAERLRHEIERRRLQASPIIWK